MNDKRPGDSPKMKLSTDRHIPSSKSRGKKAIAKGKYLALAACLLPLPGRPQARPAASSVGQRLAADLTWTVPERDLRFRHMNRVFPVHVVRHGAAARPLPLAPAISPRWTRDGHPQTVKSYMRGEHIAGLLVLQNGRIRLERYGLGVTAGSRWTSFSVTKSVTDTLAGVGLQQGWLQSLDDHVSRYLPEMRGTAYDAVTVRQLMTMTTGVRWNERYDSPDADNVRLYSGSAEGEQLITGYMGRLSREAPAGSRWQYNTGETDLLGILLRRASGKTLAELLSTSVWPAMGAERDGFWIASAAGPAGVEFGGSGISATLRDWGRYGQWVLGGGAGVVPAGWFNEATRPQGMAGGASYGYGWWPQGNGAFAALGIFGQSILVDPSRKLVIVTLADWPNATGEAHTAARAAFWHAVQQAAGTP